MKMKFVPYDPKLDLTNQFTCTNGAKGSGKSTFGLSVAAGVGPLLVIDLDRRSYSARKVARSQFGAEIVEVPGLELRPDDKRTINDLLGKKSETKVAKKSGNSYEVWVMDYEIAKDLRAAIEESLAYAISCPDSEIAGIFVDDAKILGTIWAASMHKGKISAIPKKEWGSIYSELIKTIAPLTRSSGCRKDVLFSHHRGPQYINDENTGEDEPKWIDRVIKLADNVIEHRVDPRTFQMLLEFSYKVPADNPDLFGERISGIGNLQYGIVKGLLNREIDLEDLE